MTTGTKWEMQGDYLQACSCDYGCPCEFEAPPSRGFCEGMGAWNIRSGRYGDVSLDGLAVGFAARWPDELYKGNGQGVVYLDEQANEEQREALVQIVSGQAGGMPFEIIAQVVPEVEVRFASFSFDLNGKESAARIGDEVEMVFEPVKNPVTGDSEGIRIQHETGFLFQEAEVVSNKVCRSSAGGALDFAWPDKAGFIAEFSYGN
jgi:hypothetical protein